MPYLGSTVFFASMVIALLVSMSAWMLLIRALAPQFVANARERWTRRPIVNVLLGAVCGGGLAIVGGVLLSIPFPLVRLLGGLVIASVAVGALAGLAGLVDRIGEGLMSVSDGVPKPGGFVRGALVVELSFLLPFVGWFLWMPVALAGGFGATLMALPQRIAATLRPVHVPA